MALTRKALCEDCGWHGVMENVLRAPSPFASDDTLFGCPECKGVNTLLSACDHADCWRETTCGTPTPAGYTRTCGEHRP